MSEIFMVNRDDHTTSLFKSTSLRTSHRLYDFDPASHLSLQNPCNFHTLDRFHHSWQATVIGLWDLIPITGK